MTNQPGVSPEAIKRLLAAIGTRPPAHTDVEVAEYDWRVPRRFQPRQRDRLRQFARAAGERVSASLTALLRLQVHLQAEGVTEQYGPAPDGDGAPALHVALLRQDAPCGVVSLSSETALSWLANLLGGTADPAGGAGELSPVDLELLTDVARTIGQELAAAAADAGGGPLEVGPGITQAAPAPPGAEAREFCRLSFSLARPGERGQGDSDETGPGPEDAPAVTVVLDSDVAAELCGGWKLDATGAEAEDARRRMREHVDSAFVSARVVLGVAELSVGEILSLEPGDVLVLDAGAAALRVQDQTILTGTPVRSEGEYALRVTALSAAPTDQGPPGGPTERNQPDGR